MSSSSKATSTIRLDISSCILIKAVIFSRPLTQTPYEVGRKIPVELGLHQTRKSMDSILLCSAKTRVNLFESSSSPPLIATPQEFVTDDEMYFSFIHVLTCLLYTSPSPRDS